MTMSRVCRVLIIESSGGPCIEYSIYVTAEFEPLIKCVHPQAFRWSVVIADNLLVTNPVQTLASRRETATASGR